MSTSPRPPPNASLAATLRPLRSAHVFQAALCHGSGPDAPLDSLSDDGQLPGRRGRGERVSRQGAKAPREGWVGEPDETSDALASVVVDAALEVHRHLGPAFLVQRRRGRINPTAVILSGAKDPTEPRIHGNRGVLRFAQDDSTALMPSR